MARASRFFRFVVLSFFITAAFLFMAGCGSGSSSTSGTRIRFVNASPDQATINVLIDGVTVATALANGGGATAYLPVASGARRIQIQDPSTSTNLIDTTPNISGNMTYIVNNFIAPQNFPLILTDDNSAPTAGNFKVRAVNLGPSYSSGIDAYVQPSTITTLNGLTPTFSGITFPAASSTYYTSTAGSWEVVFTPAGAQGILAGGSALTFATGQVETVLFLEDTSGVVSEVGLVDVQ